jgi:hypothetical protein
MEPQMIDHYNELPHSVNVIDKMNEELAIAQELNTNFMWLLNKNKLVMPMISPILIKEDKLPDVWELENNIETKTIEFLTSYKKGGIIADHEYDLKGVFDNSDELVEILHSELNSFPNLIVKREWCEHRVNIALDRYKSLQTMQNYFWENMLTDGICDGIIDGIKGSIVRGFNEMAIGDIFLLKCNWCNQYKSSREVESSRGGGGITKLESTVCCWECDDCDECDSDECDSDECDSDECDSDECDSDDCGSDECDSDDCGSE